MRTRPLLLMGLVLVCAAAGPARAENEASLVVTVPDGHPTVGDTVSVRVAARGGAGALWGELTVRVPEGGPWAVAGGPDEVPGSSPPVWEIQLVPLEVGELELPGFSVGLRSNQGETGTVAADGVPMVTVASVLESEDDGAPAPLRDPLGVGGFPWEWVVPIVCALLPLAVAASWWWRRRRTAAAADATLSRLPPFEELERGLDDLGSRIGREPAEVVCDRLAVALRRYLERRSGEPAAEMTSHELRVLARREGWPSVVQTGLRGVLGVADSVRFGRRPVTDGELIQGRDSALKLGRDLEEHLQPVIVEGEGT